MPAQAGTQFFVLRCEIRWVPACAGMTESTHSSFNPEVISGLILSPLSLDSKPSTHAHLAAESFRAAQAAV
jgi:hypothetical protein